MECPVCDQPLVEGQDLYPVRMAVDGLIRNVLACRWCWNRQERTGGIPRRRAQEDGSTVLLRRH